ncbi:hypothetical protein BHC49_11215 [Snodgrassella alvi]|uniref:Uncharacterized protein n=1 Tax=Snodgrassella alvi TaxID=1196083 RepID=A0A2N9XU03_9NEIS|nr:hypothetical protein BHC49_11215 [Snodgrassella alvi]
MHVASSAITHSFACSDEDVGFMRLRHTILTVTILIIMCCSVLWLVNFVYKGTVFYKAVLVWVKAGFQAESVRLDIKFYLLGWLRYEVSLGIWLLCCGWLPAQKEQALVFDAEIGGGLL